MSRMCACEVLYRIKECFEARIGYSIVKKIGCGQVNALRALSYTRITKKPLASPKHPKKPSQHLTQQLVYASQERRKYDVAKAIELRFL
jgi:hypothetical protein